MKTNALHAPSSEIAQAEYALFRQQFLRDVLEGLSQPQKTLPCKYFYDAEGARLFEHICALPEYYVTRTETALLSDKAEEMAEACGAGVEVLEFGSGAGAKIRILLGALDAPDAYMPIDISEEILLRSAESLRAEFPHIAITPHCMDYTQDSQWKLLPSAGNARRIVFFPGSTIGNFAPEEAKGFLRRLAMAAGRNGAVLIGVDLQKDLGVLERAYDDAQGVTAAFNKNILARIRDVLHVDVDVGQFSHKALYNAVENRIEMHLVSHAPQLWNVGNKRIAFARGETIHTENSYKYTAEGFRQLARSAGLQPRRLWTDAKGWFSVHLLETGA